MNKMKKYFILPLVCFIFFSCQEDSKNDNKEVKTYIKENKSGSEQNIEVLFNETEFKDSESLALLKELGHGICNIKEKDEENYIHPPCSAKFFKFFAYKDHGSMKDAFILLIKARVHDFPLRRVYIYQREQGKLVKVNSFVANLIGKRKSKTGYQDLVLRFSDQDQNHFNCIYVWKNNHYEYNRVEAINDSKIKSEFQDSMNVEILKVIETNGMQNI